MLFGRPCRVSKWISLLYSLGAFYTALFLPFPRVGEFVHGPHRDIPSYCTALGWVPFFTMPTILMSVVSVSFVVQKLFNQPSIL